MQQSTIYPNLYNQSLCFVILFPVSGLLFCYGEFNCIFVELSKVQGDPSCYDNVAISKCVSNNKILLKLFLSRHQLPIFLL